LTIFVVGGAEDAGGVGSVLAGSADILISLRVIAVVIGPLAGHGDGHDVVVVTEVPPVLWRGGGVGLVWLA
jgi:hypothetical protein